MKIDIFLSYFLWNDMIQVPVEILNDSFSTE